MRPGRTVGLEGQAEGNVRVERAAAVVDQSEAAMARIKLRIPGHA